MLSIENEKIMDAAGEAVQLRGVCVGGWMNMESFINGFPGTEMGLRAMLQEVLGPARTEFFFERWLDAILAEEDIAYIASLGANVVRLPLNYRHFESDMEPFHYRESGFARLEEALGWCAKYGLYAILDLHAVQGWQNPDWHSDNPTHTALFWQQRHFQDRFVGLWEEIARRFKGNPTVAGYDLINEPQNLGQSPDPQPSPGIKPSRSFRVEGLGVRFSKVFVPGQTPPPPSPPPPISQPQPTPASQMNSPSESVKLVGVFLT